MTWFKAALKGYGQYQANKRGFGSGYGKGFKMGFSGDRDRTDSTHRVRPQTQDALNGMEDVGGGGMRNKRRRLQGFD